MVRKKQVSSTRVNSEGVIEKQNTTSMQNPGDVGGEYQRGLKTLGDHSLKAMLFSAMHTMYTFLSMMKSLWKKFYKGIVSGDAIVF